MDSAPRIRSSRSSVFACLRGVGNVAIAEPEDGTLRSTDGAVRVSGRARVWCARASSGRVWEVEPSRGSSSSAAIVSACAGARCVLAILCPSMSLTRSGLLRIACLWTAAFCLPTPSIDHANYKPKGRAASARQKPVDNLTFKTLSLSNNFSCPASRRTVAAHLPARRGPAPTARAPRLDPTRPPQCSCGPGAAAFPSGATAARRASRSSP